MPSTRGFESHPHRQVLDLGGTLHAEGLVRSFIVELFDEGIELALLSMKIGWRDERLPF